MAILFFSLQHLAGPNTQSFSIPDGQFAVDQNVMDALTLAIGVGKVSGGVEPVIVKDANVGVPAFFQKTVLRQAHGLCRVKGEVLHRVFQRPQTEVTNQLHAANGGCRSSGMTAAGLFIIHLAVGIVRPVGTQEHLGMGHDPQQIGGTLVKVQLLDINS